MPAEPSEPEPSEQPAVGPGSVDARRRQILRAAARMLAERGYADTRVTDVSRAAGVSSALVIYYFGTRDQLLIAALRHAEDAFYEASAAEMARTGSAAGRLRHLVDLVCSPGQLDDMPRSWVLWLDMLAQAPRHPDVARDRVELDARWREAVCAVLRYGIERGEFRPVDVPQFGLLLTSVLDGLALQLVLQDPVVTADRAREVAGDLCRAYLGPDAFG
jgi:AcrR family transcriptional regulator